VDDEPADAAGRRPLRARLELVPGGPGLDWDAAAACRQFDQAIALNPAWAEAHHWHSHALCAAGRFSESLSACRQTLTLDPLNPLMHAHLAWHHYMSRDYANALGQAEHVIRMESAFHWGYFFAGWALERLGRVDEAVTSLENAARVSSNNPVMTAGLGHALAVAQDRRRALEIAGDLERSRAGKGLFAYEIGVIHAALGDRDRAFEWLARAVEERSGWIAYLRVDPRLDPLHGDARYDTLFAERQAS
jgi:tetratricopeptide (TPR) repeat protein